MENPGRASSPGTSLLDPGHPRYFQPPRNHHPILTSRINPYMNFPRRRFLRSSLFASTTLAVGFPALLRARGANEKLNIAVIGTGGRGGSNLAEVAGENIVALCD